MKKQTWKRRDLGDIEVLDGKESFLVHCWWFRNVETGEVRIFSKPYAEKIGEKAILDMLNGEV